MNEYLPYLVVDLPEDILKLKAVGDFDTLEKVINLRLEKDIPSALRYRLEEEKAIIEMMIPYYPYTYDEALAQIQDAIADFTEEEFETLKNNDEIDWIYVNGAVHFRDNFVLNILKTRPDYAKRCQKEELLDQRTNSLNEYIQKMKAQGEMTYRIHMRASFKVKKDKQRVGEVIKVHLPLPIEYAQVKNFQILKTSHEPTYIAPSDHPARTIYFEKEYEADEEFSVEYVFDNAVKYVDPDPDKVSAAQPTFYTEELYPHIKFSPYLISVAEEIVGDETNPLVQARLVYNYITQHVNYSFVRAYYTITDIPTYALTNLKGDCGIQALTFITLCRILGIPARWQAGLYTHPETVGNHDWAQFYVAPYGWLFADCSFGGSAWRSGEKERWDFYFGNLEPFRMPATSDFQHDFYPELKYRRNDPYDNQTGEAEYESVKLTLDDIETVEEIISIEEV